MIFSMSPCRLVRLCASVTLVALFIAGCGGGSDVHSSGGASGGNNATGGSSSGGSSSISWTRLAAPFSSGDSHVLSSLMVDPNGVLYAAGNNDIAKSTDGGNTWTVIDGNLPKAQIIAMGVNTLNELVVGIGTNPAVGVYRYTGGNWQQATGVSATNQISAFTLDNTGALIVVTSWGGDVFRSTDNGSSFTKVAGNIGQSGAMWTVVTAPDGSLWTGGESANGVFRSTDDGTTWQSQGLTTAQGYKGDILTIAFNAAKEPLVDRGSSDGSANLQRYTGSMWAVSATGLPAYKHVVCLVTNASGEIFACVPASVTGPSGLYRSTDGGQTWSDASQNLPGSLTVAQAALDNQGRLYVLTHATSASGAITEESTIYKSTNIP